jgi:hypothetical protein
MGQRKNGSFWAPVMLFGVAAGMILQLALKWEWGMAVAMMVAAGVALLLQQRQSA